MLYLALVSQMKTKLENVVLLTESAPDYLNQSVTLRLTVSSTAGILRSPIPNPVFPYEPRHLISNNVAF